MIPIVKMHLSNTYGGFDPLAERLCTLVAAHRGASYATLTRRRWYRSRKGRSALRRLAKAIRDAYREQRCAAHGGARG